MRRRRPPCSVPIGPTLSWLMRQDLASPLTLSVNVPDLPPRDLRGLRYARLAAFGAVQAEVGETGEGYITMTLREVDEEPEPGTDAALLAEGYATVTPLAAPCEAVGADLSGLDDQV